MSPYGTLARPEEWSSGCRRGGGRGRSGDGLAWWLLLVVLVFSMGIKATILNSDRCEVHHTSKNQESYRCPFSEAKVDVGVLRSGGLRKMLSGVILRVYKKDYTELLVAQVPFDNDQNLKCRTPEISHNPIPSVSSNVAFEWQHLRMSVKNQTLIVIINDDKNGPVFEVCPRIKVDPDQPAYLTLTPTTQFDLLLVCNCKDGKSKDGGAHCPVFPYNTLPEYTDNNTLTEVKDHWERGKKFYGRVLSSDGTVNLTVRPCITSSSCRNVGDDKRVNIAAKDIGKPIGVWEQLVLKRDKVQTKNVNEPIDVVVLKLGDAIRVLKMKDNNNSLGLKILKSRGIEWAVGCRPEYNFSTSAPRTSYQLPTSPPCTSYQSSTSPARTPYQLSTSPARASYQSSTSPPCTSYQPSTSYPVATGARKKEELEEFTKWKIVFLTFLVPLLMLLTAIVTWRRASRAPDVDRTEQSVAEERHSVSNHCSARPAFPLPPGVKEDADETSEDDDLYDYVDLSAFQLGAGQNTDHHKSKNSHNKMKNIFPCLSLGK